MYLCMYYVYTEYTCMVLHIYLYEGTCILVHMYTSRRILEHEYAVFISISTIHTYLYLYVYTLPMHANTYICTVYYVSLCLSVIRIHIHMYMQAHMSYIQPKERVYHARYWLPMSSSTQKSYDFRSVLYSDLRILTDNRVNGCFVATGNNISPTSDAAFQLK